MNKSNFIYNILHSFPGQQAQHSPCPLPFSPSRWQVGPTCRGYPQPPAAPAACHHARRSPPPLPSSSGPRTPLRLFFAVRHHTTATTAAHHSHRRQARTRRERRRERAHRSAWRGGERRKTCEEEAHRRFGQPDSVVSNQLGARLRKISSGGPKVIYRGISTGGWLSQPHVETISIGGWLSQPPVLMHLYRRLTKPTVSTNALVLAVGLANRM